MVDVEQIERARRRTDAWELDAAVTAFWRTALLLCMLVLELSARCLYDPDFVGACIVSSNTRSVAVLRGEEPKMADSKRDSRISPSLYTENISIRLFPT